jgi:hypothetical protein
MSKDVDPAANSGSSASFERLMARAKALDWSGGSVRWLGVVTDLEAAKLRVKELSESKPGEYFIFSLATGHRLEIKVEDAGGGTQTRK